MGALATVLYIERPVPAKVKGGADDADAWGPHPDALQYLWSTTRMRRAGCCSILILSMTGIGMRKTSTCEWVCSTDIHGWRWRQSWRTRMYMCADRRCCRCCKRKKRISILSGKNSCRGSARYRRRGRKGRNLVLVRHYTLYLVPETERRRSSKPHYEHYFCVITCSSALNSSLRLPKKEQASSCCACFPCSFYSFT